MTSEAHSKLIRPHSAFSRMLSLLLLGLVVYGTTVQAAHRHGRIAASVEPTDTLYLVHKNDEQGIGGQLVKCGDCLICQLHQNFSTALTPDRFVSPQAQIGTLFYAVAAPNFSFSHSTPRTGRAPPLAN